ncbi:MAG: right-handed parallel beta-helix repeat-containing protein [Deltaproteobacteria bacterium]|nr:right-handed parallel beta-helix repeat-containing protein [Deltaproteobacteria bacterium]
MTRRLFVVFMLYTLTAGYSLAAELYVDQSAAGGGDGSQASPFQTINEVKSVLRTGDTVWILDGVYNETVDFWRVSAGTDGRTFIRAAPGHTPIIDGGGGSGFVFQAGETHRMTFQGLTVRNSQGSAFHFYHADEGEVIECKSENTGNGVAFYFSSQGYVSGSDLYGGVSGKESDGTVIKECRIHHSQGEGITLHADSKNLQYLNNVVYDNHSVNIYIDSASNVVVDGNLVFMTEDPPEELAGIQLADESYNNVTSPVMNNITITNNILVNNYYGIVFWRGHFPGESGMKNVLIANNTVVNNKRLGIVWDEGPHDAVIQNNIFAAESGDLLMVAKSTEGVSLDHNLWYLPGASEPINWGGGQTFDHTGWVAASGQGDGDVLTDPAFEGPGDLNAASYKLTEGSPAIDMGVVIDGLDIDFERALRPVGSGYDLGAYEYGAPPNPDGGLPSIPDAGADADSDSDGDTDSDVDTDGDADSDMDGDTDSDMDGDTDSDLDDNVDAGQESNAGSDESCGCSTPGRGRILSNLEVFLLAIQI